MYIVRDKATRKIIHANPAPLSQGLEGTDIYYQFDPETMEVGKGEPGMVPEHFDIDAEGAIVPWTLERQIKEGLKMLPPELKAVGDKVVEKTLTEMILDGTRKLGPTEKLVNDKIEQKTVAEQVADGTIKLEPTQIVDGEQIREMTDAEKVLAGHKKLDPAFKIEGKRIVPKTPAELVKDKLIELAPNQKVRGDEIVELTPREMLAEGRLNLQEYKQAVLDRVTETSLAARRKEAPDHMLLYAALGVLEPQNFEKVKRAASEHAKLLDKVAKDIEKASSADEVDRIAGHGDWPKKLRPKSKLVTS